jgi:hypothetical protein
MSVPAARVASPPRKLAIHSGRVAGPIVYLLFGVEGIGKSTFGAQSPDPVFLDIERGTNELNVARVDEPEAGWTWTDVLESLRLLETEAHDRKTLVIDTLDELEALLWAHICKRDSKSSIEDYGYGKGFQAALDEWRVFMAAIERLHSRRAMHVGLLAHAMVKTFKNPEGNDYDRYQPKMHEKAAGYLKSKSHVVLFANLETFAKKKDENSKSEKAKGISTGERLMFTQRTPAYDAKNRHNLPPQMPLSASALFAAVTAFQSMSVADQVKALIPNMKTEKLKQEAVAAMGRADSDLRLAQLLNWIRENS